MTRLSRERIESARNLMLRRACPPEAGCGCLHCAAYRTALIALDAYEAQPDLLREIARGGVELDDPRLGYVTVQIDRETWQAIRERDDG